MTPEMLAAAWSAFRAGRPGVLLGPGPAFREAIEAALAVLARDEGLVLDVRRVIAPLNGCENGEADLRACVNESCTCLRVAREVASLVGARGTAS